MMIMMIPIGYSLGANVLVKYLGEEGSNTLLSGAVSISNPFRLQITSTHLEGQLFHRTIYSKTFANNLKRFVRRYPKLILIPIPIPIPIIIDIIIHFYSVVCGIVYFSWLINALYYQSVLML